MTDFLIVLFGITGDLNKRSIIPALYSLYKNKKLNNFYIIGIAKENLNKKEIFQKSKEFIKDFDEQTFNNLISKCDYLNLDITKLEDYKILNEKISEHNFKNRIFYCAVSSDIYVDITQNLIESKILQKNDKIVFEKPIGHNLETAIEINKSISKLLDESQIYRIDHYLAKEIVETIAFVRFTNQMFEPLWNNKYIDSIQIILDEEVCLEERGAFYDKYGAIQDVVQNHMLQLLALTTMEAPDDLTGDSIRNCKAEILKNVEISDVMLGQYDGYLFEKNIVPNSKTETFAVLRLMINNNRWKNVPFYLKTGKCLEKKQTKIEIKFKMVDCLFPLNCPIDSNYLTISIYPKEGLILELNVKTPNMHNQITKMKSDFCYSCLYSPEEPQAYEHIILDILSGNKSVSVRQDEIEYSWKIIDKIKDMILPIYKYKKSSQGPKEINEFAKKYGIKWR